MGCCGGRRGAHRPDQHLSGVAARDARCRDASAACGRSFAHRCRAPGLRSATKSYYPRRRAFRLNCGASILAKVERDRMMCEWDAVFPEYGLASHKGYSTPQHLAALEKYGPTPLHRQSFAPVWGSPVEQVVFEFD